MSQTTLPAPTNPVNQADIQMLRDWVNAGKAEQAYDYLADRGYAYAALASGVAGADSLGGVFALAFMQETATRAGVGRSRYAEESPAAVLRIILHLHPRNGVGMILQHFARTNQHDEPPIRAL